MNLENIKVGDIVALVSLYEGKSPVKVIGETKKYFKISLKNLSKGHSARFDFKNWDEINHTLDTQLYSKTTGIRKGSGDAISRQYYPDYIMNLDEAIASMECDIAECKDDHGLENYCKEIEKALAECKKAKIEGIPA